MLIHVNHINTKINYNKKAICVRVNDDVYMYIYTVYFYLPKTQPKTQPGLEISFQTKLRECFSNFLGLAKFLRLEETVDWSKLLKFGRTCSN